MKEKIKKLLTFDKRTISKIITAIESEIEEEHIEALTILENLISKPRQALKVGIFGPPGVGKSSLINSLGKHLAQDKNSKIAVLAIDPTSPLFGGSILGDLTRMEDLIKEENIYIRPSPSKSARGGIGENTSEIATLLDLIGFNYILIETVGIGQLDIDITKICDVNLLILQPGEGDYLQGMKKGYLECTDLLIINKDDGDLKNLAEETYSQYRGEFKHDKSDFVLKFSSKDPARAIELWEKIDDFYKDLSKKELSSRRNIQITTLLKSVLNKKIQRAADNLISSNEKITDILNPSEKLLPKNLRALNSLSVKIKI